MDNRYEIAEQNGMNREFADWFFDNKKAGCGNVWFMMMAAMWEGWQGRAAMLQGADGNSPQSPESWVACSERMPMDGFDVLCASEFDGPGDWRRKVGYWHRGKWVVYGASWTPTHWMPLPAAPQHK